MRILLHYKYYLTKMGMRVIMRAKINKKKQTKSLSVTEVE